MWVKKILHRPGDHEFNVNIYWVALITICYLKIVQSELFQIPLFYTFIELWLPDSYLLFLCVLSLIFLKLSSIKYSWYLWLIFKIFKYFYNSIVSNKKLKCNDVKISFLMKKNHKINIEKRRKKMITDQFISYISFAQIGITILLQCKTSSQKWLIEVFTDYMIILKKIDGIIY